MKPEPSMVAASLLILTAAAIVLYTAIKSTRGRDIYFRSRRWKRDEYVSESTRRRLGNLSQ